MAPAHFYGKHDPRALYNALKQQISHIKLRRSKMMADSHAGDMPQVSETTPSEGQTQNDRNLILKDESELTDRPEAANTECGVQENNGNIEETHCEDDCGEEKVIENCGNDRHEYEGPTCVCDTSDQKSSCTCDKPEKKLPEESSSNSSKDSMDNYAIDVCTKDELQQSLPNTSRKWWSCLPFCCKRKETSEIDVLTPEEEKALYIAREKRNIIKNTCIISIAFLFVFSAFQGLTRLQSSLHRDRGMGTICQSVMYATLVASCLVMPNICIHTIGLKKTIIISFLGYIVWFAANGYAVWGTMVTASILMGIAAGPLWTAQSSYFTILAARYSELTGKDRSAVLSKFFGIFFAFYQFSGIVGSVITTVVLLPSEQNVTSAGDRATSCGAKDCPWAESITGHLAKPDKITVWIMLAVFLVMAVVAVVITYYFLEDLPISLDSHVKLKSMEDSDVQSEKTSQTAVSDTITYVSTETTPGAIQDGGETKGSHPFHLSLYQPHLQNSELKLFESVECVYPGDFEQVIIEDPNPPPCTESKRKIICSKDNCRMVFSTLRHLRHLDQLLLVPLTFYMGLEQGTSAANFTKSYIACTIGIAKIGLVYISYSAINGCASFTSGRLVKYTGRFPVLTTAFIGDLIVQSTLQLWAPEESQQYVLYLLAGLWGFTDGIWHTQVTALYGAIFTEDPTAAFSCMRLLKAVGAITAFAYSSSLCTSVKVYILTSLLIVSMVGYYAVEFRQKFSKKKKVDFEEEVIS